MPVVRSYTELPVGGKSEGYGVSLVPALTPGAQEALPLLGAGLVPWGLLCRSDFCGFWGEDTEGECM